MKRMVFGWTGLVLLVMAAVLSPFLLQRLASPALPETIGSLRRLETLDGDRAAALVDKLHGKGVSTSKNLIGAYRGAGASATLYRTVYASSAEAERNDERMAAMIERGNNAFEHFHRGVRMERTVSMCLGMGQVHFFFASGRSLYWLAVDPPVAREALEALLREL